VAKKVSASFLYNGLVPHSVDERFGRHRLSHRGGQDRQYMPLLGWPGIQDTATGADLHRAQHPKLHSVPPHPPRDQLTGAVSTDADPVNNSLRIHLTTAPHARGTGHDDGDKPDTAAGDSATREESASSLVTRYHVDLASAMIDRVPTIKCYWAVAKHLYVPVI
jgi:hypothetical protein